MLTLPKSISATDLKFLSMYCVTYADNFGEVIFPDSLNVPPYTEVDVEKSRTNFNCEPLNKNLQVSWIISDDRDSIAIELAGDIDRNGDYMAFGLSGSDDGISMVNADVVVTDFKESQEPRAIDYFLTARSQCADGNGGACPDTSSFNKASNDVMMVTGRVTNGITRIMYHRSLATDDVGTTDKAFKIDGTEQYIVWAIGPLNSRNEVAKHYAPPAGIIKDPTKFDFDRTALDSCPSFVLAGEEKKPAFQPHHLYGKEGTVFTAEIGQAMSTQGYKALTGLTSWGIAWYINGILIPELHLKRGISYTFRVGGGTIPAEGSKYHPLYFTDDVEGGHPQNSNETIYQGKVNSLSVDYAVGDYCEWKLTNLAIKKSASGFVYQCFEEFKEDLELDCDLYSPEYTDFVFTPSADTPDVIYYQCYTHKNLGWKIHIYDELPSEEIVDVPCTPTKGPEGGATTTKPEGGTTTGRPGGGPKTAGFRGAGTKQIISFAPVVLAFATLLG